MYRLWDRVHLKGFKLGLIGLEQHNMISTALFCSAVSYQICSVLHVNVVREADAGDHVWRNVSPQTRLLILQLLQTSDGEGVLCTDVQSTWSTVIALE